MLYDRMPSLHRAWAAVRLGLSKVSFSAIQSVSISTGNPQTVFSVETRVSLSVHYQLLSLPKQHPALILRTSLVPPRTFILFFTDSARARLALLPISCPSHVRWRSLVRSHDISFYLT
jgi:hypothetical protein